MIAKSSKTIDLSQDELHQDNDNEDQNNKEDQVNNVDEKNDDDEEVEEELEDISDTKITPLDSSVIHSGGELSYWLKYYIY